MSLTIGEAFSNDNLLDKGVTRPLIMRAVLVISFLYFASSSPAFASFNLDIDDDGKTDALTDGLLILRYMFGLSGENLTAGIIGADAERLDSDQIVTYLAANNDHLDIDGNDSVDALTDGLLILRDLFGLTNLALVTDVIPDNATRSTSNTIIAYMGTIKDSDGDNTNDAFDMFPLNNSENIDTDSDGIGNNADTDDDGDGRDDYEDAFPLDAFESVDTDGDEIGNNADPDDDGDGVEDSLDAFPLDPSETLDTDSDNVGNSADPDDDNDSVLDADDAFPLDSMRSKFVNWGFSTWSGSAWDLKPQDIIWNETTWSN